MSIDVIHSDLSPVAREAAINKFRVGETWVLIATDLLGRGLDFLGLNTVVNYDFPQVVVRCGIEHRAGLSTFIAWVGPGVRGAEERQSRYLRRMIRWSMECGVR